MRDTRDTKNTSKDKKIYNKQVLDIFVKITRKKAKEEIENEERTRERKLSEYERKSIIEKNARKAQFRASIVGLGLSLIAIGGIGSGIKALNSGNEPEKTEISSEIDEDKTTENLQEIEEQKNARTEFLNELHVDTNNLEDLRNKIEEDINNLKPEEVLNYAKQYYADKYNEMNNTNITVDDITFSYNTTRSIYRGKAENGDTIIRSHSASDELRIENKGIIDVNIRGNKIESITPYNNEYYLVYSPSDMPERNGDIVNGNGDYSIALEQAYILRTSINYADEFKNNSSNVLDYKNEMINAVYNYEKSKQTQQDNSLNVVENEDLEINE